MLFALKDTVEILLQLACSILFACLGYFLVVRARTAMTHAGPSWFDKLLRVDRRVQMLALTLFCVIMGVASNIFTIWLVVRKVVTDQAVILMVGNFNGGITIACISQPLQYWFGTSNGSQTKDEKGAGGGQGGVDPATGASKN